MPTRILTHLKTILVYFQLFFSLHHHACLPFSLSLVSCKCFRLSTSNSVCLWSLAHVSVCLLQIWSVFGLLHMFPFVSYKLGPLLTCASLSILVPLYLVHSFQACCMRGFLRCLLHTKRRYSTSGPLPSFSGIAFPRSVRYSTLCVDFFLTTYG
jgi:hypothetical protein